METVGAFHTKTHLPSLLNRVVKGEKIIITRHGTPVAVLQPHESLKKRNPRDVIQELKKFREKNSLKGISIREMINEGRR